MSFKVDWNSLKTDSLRDWTKEVLQDALNSGKRPNILASQITIKDLNFGKTAPDFEILEIGELDKDRFRGIFKINYAGDFHLTLNTKVEGNPLKIYSSNSLQDDTQGFVTPEFLLSNDSFNIPLDLKLSDIKISGIGIIVFSKTKGLTLVFKNDPLDSIKVSSTFDNVKVLANFLQIQIENQIRDLFRETLPTVIHQLSLKYILSSSNEFLHEFHEQMINGLDMDLDSDKVTFNEMDDSQANYNLVKILKLFNSREKLDLSIPKFKDVIQRLHLEKFKKNFAPTLAHSLNISTTNGTSNGIPINVLISEKERGGFNSIDNTLTKITGIQLTNFYKSNNKKPKRRVIKIKKKKNDEVDELTTDTSATIDSLSVPISTTPMTASLMTSLSSMTTLENTPKSKISSVKPSPMKQSNSTSTHIHQPIPLKIPREIYETKLKVHLKELASPITPVPSPYSHSKFQYNSTSPVNSNSSFLSGLGLGNNYFNFTTTPPETQQQQSEPVHQISLTNVEREKIEAEIRKSMNYINMNEVIKSQNLKKLQKQSKKGGFENNHSIFQDLPPPYYQV